MRPFIRSFYRAALIGSTALALSFVPTNARAQRTSAQDSPPSRVAVSGQQNANANLNSEDADRMDQFLDDHKDIDKDLKKDPSLVTSKKYLDHHKEFRSFLEEHPRTQGEFARNPNYFTHRQDRLAAGRVRVGENAPSNTPQNADRDRDRYGNGQNPGQRTGEAARLDEFLDSHQQIDRDLTANPSLANNNTYLDQHQDLRTFLNDHPDLREQFAKNPNGLIQAENRFDAREARTTQDRDRDRDVRVADSRNGYAANSNPDRDQDRDRNLTGRDQDRDRYANGQNPENGYAANSNPDRDQDRDQMNQFLGDHKDIDKDLRKNPSLVNDQKYLGHHKDLRSFFNEHPQARQEFAQNPAYFMGREERFDSRERFDANWNYTRSNSNAAPNLTDKQAAQMDRFLDKHKDVDRDLSANPSLCKDDKYLHHHKDLRTFLNKNPEVRTQLAGNSSFFAQRHERMEEHRAPVNRAKPAKPAPAKTPIQQHETTTPATPH